MDPLAALSLAGTIVQFVDFGSKLLATGRELYKSTNGSLTVNDEIELVTSDLLAITLKLRPDQNIGPELQKFVTRLQGWLKNCSRDWINLGSDRRAKMGSIVKRKVKRKRNGNL
jgi:hypothetical protein